MLGPNFMEGQMLTTSHTIELPLYEDNRDALKIVCQILHVRNNDVPQDVYEESLCVIAELTDKYDLAEAIKPTAECWINRWLSRAQKEDPEAGAFEPKHIRPLLVAAYFFQHAELFQRLSTLMVYRSSEVIFDKSEAWAVDDEQSDILRKVFGMSSTMLSEAKANIAKPCLKIRGNQPLRYSAVMLRTSWRLYAR